MKTRHVFVTGSVAQATAAIAAAGAPASASTTSR